jgi:Haloacid dehalogenase-like hydrolase
VRRLGDQGLTVRFTTNTDSVPPAALADRLARRGFPATEDELVTPIAVAARLFGSMPQARVLAVAADGVRELLAGRLAGPGERVTHVLVADPATGQPMTTWPPTSAVVTRSARPRCRSAAARVTAPQPGAEASRTRSSTAPPTCQDCSKAERPTTALVAGSGSVGPRRHPVHRTDAGCHLLG